jgi:crotonobetainyl-CoA:carnitine CoA-transferase CaiB-like acyl-CoA transferase
MDRALDDLTVLDISTTPAGAWCSRLLADFGADVVVAEPVGGPIDRLPDDPDRPIAR